MRALRGYGHDGGARVPAACFVFEEIAVAPVNPIMELTIIRIIINRETQVTLRTRPAASGFSMVTHIY